MAVTVILSEPWGIYAADSTLSVGTELATMQDAAALVGNGRARWGTGGPPTLSTAFTVPVWSTGTVYSVGQLAAHPTTGDVLRRLTAGTARATFDITEAGQWTVDGGGGGGGAGTVPLTVTATKTADYALTANQFAPFDCTAASRVATLPNGPADGTIDGARIDALTNGNTLTLTAQGIDTFKGGGTTFALSLLDESVILTYRASDHTWIVTEHGYPKSAFAPVASPTLTGDPKAPTPSAGDNDTSIATTAFVAAALTSQFLAAFNVQTGTSYTLVLSDAGVLVEANNASANTVTVPPNSSVAFPIGTEVGVAQYGAGLTTIAAGAGVTIRFPSGVTSGKIAGQYSIITLIKRGTNEWYATGDFQSG